MKGHERNEAERRELAERHRGEVVSGSGEAIEGRSLPHIVSVRLQPHLIAALRELARDRGVSVSDLIREGAQWVTEASRMRPISLQVRLVTTQTPTIEEETDAHTATAGY